MHRVKGIDFLMEYAVAHDQSHDIWRLELGKIKNTTFLVKRKFLFLRTI